MNRCKYWEKHQGLLIVLAILLFAIIVFNTFGSPVLISLLFHLPTTIQIGLHLLFIISIPLQGILLMAFLCWLQGLGNKEIEERLSRKIDWGDLWG